MKMIVFRDVAARAMRRELKAAARAAIKHTGNDDGFDRWASRFYDEQQAMIYDLFQAPAQALSEAMGGDGKVQDAVRQFSTEQADLSRKYIVVAFGEGRLENRLEEWQELRPEAMARQMMKKVMETLTNGN